MKLNKNILVFFSFSLGIHLVLLLSFHNKAYLLPATTGSKLSINFHQPTIAEQNKTPAQNKNPIKQKNIPAVKNKRHDRPTAEKNVLPTTLPASLKETQPEQKEITTTDLTPVMQTAAQKTIRSESTAATNQAKIISQLKLKLRHYFYYPRLAQRRNWQGEVLLAFDVNTKGLIQNVSVEKSSGYNILDTAAVNSLSSINRVETDSTHLKDHSGLNLNIKYRLEEG